MHGRLLGGLSTRFALLQSEVPVTTSVPLPAAFFCRGVCALGEGIGNRELGIGNREVLNVVRSAYLGPAWGSGMLLGCLETPLAFLNAVPNA